MSGTTPRRSGPGGGALTKKKERVCSRLCDFDKRLLSRAGKEILLKSIIQTIPSYVMSVFLLPTTFCAQIEIMMNSFW